MRFLQAIARASSGRFARAAKTRIKLHKAAASIPNATCTKQKQQK
jgi:hypothetical protein